MKTQENMKVVMVLYRYRPQFGCFCTLKEIEVVGSDEKTMTVLDGATRRKFDFFGNEVDAPEELYYMDLKMRKVFAFDAAKEVFDKEKGTFDGFQIMQGKEIMLNL